MINQKVAGSILKQLGLSTDFASNGEQALSILKNTEFDLILMDCQMPIMDGYEASTKIRSNESDVLNHNVPIIAMTANAMKGDREKCLASGMNDYIAKPVNLEIIKKTIEPWIKQAES